MGGVFTAPISERGEGLLTLEAPRARFDYRWEAPDQNPISKTSNLLTDVREVRHDLLGNLYARVGQGNRVARLEMSGSWIGVPALPEDQNSKRQNKVVVQDGRLVADGRPIQRSNDLFSGRRDLADIVGQAYDAEDDSLWLATRREGLFKVVLRALLD